MHAQTAVQAGAREADEGAEFGGGPLRGGGGAVDAGGVSGTFLEGRELQFCQLEGIELVGGGGDLGLSFRVDFPHFNSCCMDNWTADCLLCKSHNFARAIENLVLVVDSRKGLSLEWNAHEWETSPIDKRASQRPASPFYRGLA